MVSNSVTPAAPDAEKIGEIPAAPEAAPALIPDQAPAREPVGAKNAPLTEQEAAPAVAPEGDAPLADPQPEAPDAGDAPAALPAPTGN